METLKETGFFCSAPIREPLYNSSLPTELQIVKSEYEGIRKRESSDTDVKSKGGAAASSTEPPSDERGAPMPMRRRSSLTNVIEATSNAPSASGEGGGSLQRHKSK